MGAGGDRDSVLLLPLASYAHVVLSLISHWVHILDPKGQHPTLQDVVPELVLWLSLQQHVPLLH